MEYLFLFGAGLLISAIVTPLLIPLLHRLKFGQSIREIGPSWHQKKSGTPTMGGIGFAIALLVAVLLFGDIGNLHMRFALLASFSFGIVGFLDDMIKVVFKRNLGLKAYQKFGLQLIASIFLVMYGYSTGLLSSVIEIPFTALTWDMGILYFPFAIFLCLGAVNSVNLTDGLDGLATSVTIAVLLYFGATGLLAGNGAQFPFALIGALVGFLIYNAHPAKLFMGDTGSLFLGGAVSALALASGNPLMLIVIGAVYLAETLSVMIQVTYFKKTGKRIFKMSPIHHHFEMCGWSEIKIVFVFAGITAALVLLALLLG